MIYIFDLDGTLCDNRHRLHYITGDKKDYHAYHLACVDDDPLPLIKVLQAVLGLSKYFEFVPSQVRFFSGRSNIAFEQTVEWLYSVCSINQVDNTVLRMRKEGDWRQDWVIKQEWLLELLQKNNASEIIAFDDRQQCVDMYRRNGVTCCQVADGDF